MPLPPALFFAILALHLHLGHTQQVTAISQAPGFSSLASCAQGVAVAVIDNSNSPECPGGSPPNCFCGAEAASKEYSDQISTNVLNSCITSPRPEATQAASVFAAYCSLGGTAKGSSSVTGPSKTGGESTTPPPSATATTSSTSPTSQSGSSSQPSGWTGLPRVAQIFTIIGPIMTVIIFVLGWYLDRRRRRKKRERNSTNS